MAPKSPCKNCTQRQIGCHSKCTLYAGYRACIDKTAKELNKLKEIDGALIHLSKVRLMSLVRRGGR